jgi:hypothetical protein
MVLFNWQGDITMYHISINGNHVLTISTKIKEDIFAMIKVINEGDKNIKFKIKTAKENIYESAIDDFYEASDIIEHAYLNF